VQQLIASPNEKYPNGSHAVLPSRVRNEIVVNGTIRPQNPCVSSWLAWAAAKRQWESSHPTYSYNAIGDMSSTVIGVISSYTLCDGIPRIKIASTATERWISSITVPVFASATSTPSEDATITPFNMPVPACSVSPAQCSDEWYRLFRREQTPDDFDPLWALEQFSSNHKSDQSFLGCTPPQELCRSPVESLPSELRIAVHPNGGCTVEAGRFALMFFPETIESSDLCASNGLGHYITAAQATKSRSPTLFSTSAVVVHTHNFNYPGVDFYAKDGRIFSTTYIKGMSKQDTKYMLQDLHMILQSLDPLPSHSPLQVFTWVKTTKFPATVLSEN
jgi:hypothetical protein